MAKTIVGMFSNASDAHAAVGELAALGIPRDQISIVTKKGDETTTTSGTGDTKASPEGIGIGATTGALAGGTAGILASLGLLAIPGIGPLLAAGPIVAALTGAGIGAAAGGLVGGLIGLGIPDDDAEVYAEGVNRGHTLLTLTADDAVADRAAAVLDRHNAVDVDRQATSWSSSGWTSKYDRSGSSSTDRGSMSRRGTETTTSSGMSSGGMGSTMGSSAGASHSGDAGRRSACARVYSRSGT